MPSLSPKENDRLFVGGILCLGKMERDHREVEVRERGEVLVEVEEVEAG